MPRTKSSPGVSCCNLSEVSRASSAKLRWIWPFSAESWKVNNDHIIWYEAEISVGTVPVGVYIYIWWSPLQGRVNNNLHTEDWKTEAGILRDLPDFNKASASRLHWSPPFCRGGFESPFMVPVSGFLTWRLVPIRQEGLFFLLSLPSAFWSNEIVLWRDLFSSRCFGKKKEKKNKECDFLG